MSVKCSHYRPSKIKRTYLLLFSALCIKSFQEKQRGLGIYFHLTPHLLGPQLKDRFRVSEFRCVCYIHINHHPLLLQRLPEFTDRSNINDIQRPSNYLSSLPTAFSEFLEL